MKVNIYFRLFCYPTEDLEKNKEIFKILGIDEIEISEIEEAFGLPMYILSSTLTKKDKIINFFKRLFELAEKEYLINKIKENFVKKDFSIYLRIDKQELYKNKKIKIVSHGDVVHVKIKLIEPRDIEKFIEELNQLLK